MFSYVYSEIYPNIYQLVSNLHRHIAEKCEMYIPE